MRSSEQAINCSCSESRKCGMRLQHLRGQVNGSIGPFASIHTKSGSGLSLQRHPSFSDALEADIQMPSEQDNSLLCHRAVVSPRQTCSCPAVRGRSTASGKIVSCAAERKAAVPSRSLERTALMPDGCYFLGTPALIDFFRLASSSGVLVSIQATHPCFRGSWSRIP